MTTLVRAATLSHFEEVAAEVGIEARGILDQVGLSADMRREKERRIPLVSVITALEMAADASGCATIGLRMAEKRELADFGTVSLLLAFQPTLRDILVQLIHHLYIVAPALAISMEESKGLTIIRDEVVAPDAPHSRQAAELAVAIFFRMGERLMGARWRPKSVHFTHAPPQMLDDHRRLFRCGGSCELIFNSDFNGLVLDAKDLSLANPSADAAMALEAERVLFQVLPACEQTAADEVRKALHMLLPTGRASIEEAAAGLGLNVRSLQRRLEQEGSTFSDLVNDVRRSLALQYIANRTYSLAEVAERLGYSAHSSFTRWFQSEFGESPKAWRERAAQARQE